MKSSFVRNKHAARENRAGSRQKMRQERETLMEEIRQLRAAVQIYTYLVRRAARVVEG